VFSHKSGTAAAATKIYYSAFLLAG